MCPAYLVVEKNWRNVDRTAAILKIVPYANLCKNTFADVISRVGGMWQYIYYYVLLHLVVLKNNFVEGAEQYN